MEFRHNLEIVTKDMQDIEKLVSNFKNYSRLPLIELDLALSKLQNVYETLLIIRNYQYSMGQEAMPPKSPEETHHDSNNEIAPGIVTTEEVIIEEIIEVTKIRSEVINQAIADSPMTEGINRNEEFPGEINAGSKQPFDKTGRIIAEKYQAEQSLINEKIREKRKTDISALHQSSPIKTIIGSMGINDKFIFIRELFHGDAELFRQTLENLDSSRDYSSACNYIADKFNWNMESETVESLLSLIRRKFINSGNE